MEDSDWRPSARAGMWWTVVGTVLVAAGLVVFGIPVFARSGRTVIQISLLDFGIVVVLVAALLLLHEGIHAAVMAAFGARPRFGTTLVGGTLPAIYTTSTGHRFTRMQYLAVAMTPGIAISTVGFAACFTGVGAYLVLPLAMHLGGCVGDAAATWRVLHAPPGTMFEDLRDGIRFHRAQQGTR